MMSTGLSAILGSIFTAVAISAITSWITIQLSLGKLRKAKIWDKRVHAYTRIVESLRNIMEYYDDSFNVESEGRTLDAPEKVRMRATFEEAKKEIQKACDFGTFLISERAFVQLTNCIDELQSTRRIEDPVKWLNEGSNIATRHLKEMIKLAKKDLKFNWWWQF